MNAIRIVTARLRALVRPDATIDEIHTSPSPYCSPHRDDASTSGLNQTADLQFVGANERTKNIGRVGNAPRFSSRAVPSRRFPACR